MAWIRDRVAERADRGRPTARSCARRAAAASTGSTCGSSSSSSSWTTLGLRTFRLAEPYQMHFDEVYHARTATEFLQDWRYGLVARHLRVDAPAPRQVRHGRRHRRCGARTTCSATSELGVAGPRRRRRAAPRGRRRPASAPASGCTSRPARRSGPTTSGPGSSSSIIAGAGRQRAGRSTRPPSSSSSATTTAASRRSTWRRSAWAGSASTSALTPSTARPASTTRSTHLLVDERRRDVVAASDRPADDRGRSADGSDRRDARPAGDRRPRAGGHRRRRSSPTGRRGRPIPPRSPRPSPSLSAATRPTTRRASPRPSTRDDGRPRQPRERRRADGGRRGHRRRHACPASRSTPCRGSRSPTRDGRRLRRPERRPSVVDDARARRAARTASPWSPASTTPKLYVTIGRRRRPAVRRHRRRRRRGQGRPGQPGPTTRCRRPATWVAYDEASQQVHILGLAPGRDGARPDALDRLRRRAARQRRLRRRPAARGFEPVAWAPDVEPDVPVRRTASSCSSSTATARRPRSSSGSHAFAWRLPGRHRRRADGRAASTCWRGSCSGAASSPASSALFVLARRDALRPVADRDERRLRRPVHRRRVHASSPRSGPAGGAGRGGVLAGDAGRSASCSGSPSPPSGSRPTRSARWCCCILVRSALGRVLAILGLIAITERARLHGDQRARRGRRGVRQPDVPADHDRADPRRGRRRGPPPDRLDRRRAAVRGRSRRRRSVRSSSSARSPLGPARHRRSRSGRSRSRRCSSRSRSPLGSLVVVGALLAGRSLGLRAARRAAGARRPGPAARAARRRRRTGWLRPGWLLGLPVVWVAVCLVVAAARRLRRLVHPVGVRSRATRSSTGWPAGPHRPDAARPDRPDVRLPQRPDGARTRRRRRGGPGRSTSSRSGSTRRASPAARRPRSTTPATSSSGGWAIPAMAFVAWMAFKRRSLALTLIADRLRRPVDPVGADRSGRVPVPLLHGAAVRGPRPRLLRRRAVARRVPPRPGCSPGSRRRSRSLAPGGACGSSAGRCARSSACESVNPGSAGLPGRHPAVRADRADGRARGRRRGRPAGHRAGASSRSQSDDEGERGRRRATAALPLARRGRRRGRARAVRRVAAPGRRRS